MLKRLNLIAILAISGTILINAQVLAIQSNWQFFKEIPAQKPGFALVQLDSEAMENCQSTFADIRVTDQNGREIASQVVQPGQNLVVQTVSLLNAINYPDHTSITIDMGPNQRPHNRLDLTIDMNMNKTDAYLREVEIMASDDAYTWGKLGSGKIFAYQYQQYNQITYPTSTMRYLQVNIMNQAGESPLRVSSAQLLFLAGNIYVGQALPAAVLTQRTDRTTTTLVVDLGVPNYMVTEVEIRASDRNYDRNITITTSAKAEVKGQEELLASERIIAYDWNNYNLAKDRVNVYHFSRRYLIISILNQDSPALDIKGISVYGAAPYVLAELAAPSILWYGNPQANAPIYDLRQFADLISKTDLPVQNIGPQQSNPAYQPPVVPWTERNKWLLDATIVLVAAGLAALILRKIRQLGDEERT
ncbi:MAG: hypothetical protein GYA42_09290 [Syntrophomonadaceae bacterium]|nr:hypothetical protein [Syntrophomonadaceae bacterium]